MINKGYLTAKTNKESDEVFTPDYVVEKIIPYIKNFEEKKGRKIVVWCPFDESDSAFVRVLQQHKIEVIYSHIDNGKNFFEYEPEKYDVIISNPPFSIKDGILKRLYELNTPYAVLMPLPVLQGQKRYPYIKECQAIIFNKRINFYKDKITKEIQKGVSFATIFLCKDFLEKDLIFEEF